MDEQTSITQPPVPPAPHPEPVERVIYLLFWGMIFFTVALFVEEKMWPTDGQIFQVISNLLAGFSGAFFMRIKQSGERK